jgi:hypothetical protein
MAPILNSSGLQPIHIAIIIISCIIFMAILPFIITTFWIIGMDIWRVMFKNRPKYLQREKLRKEWNKAAQAERQRQQTVKCCIRDNIERKRESEERCMLLLELVSIRTL